MSGTSGTLAAGRKRALHGGVCQQATATGNCRDVSTACWGVQMQAGVGSVLRRSFRTQSGHQWCMYVREGGGGCG